MPDKTNRNDCVRLEVKAELIDVTKGEETPPLSAYAYSAGGRLLDKQALQAGKAALSIPANENPQNVRVLVGHDDDREEVTASELRRLGAEENLVRIDPDGDLPQLEVAILPGNWRHWLGFLCCVPGKLLKRVDTDGIPIDMPVCHAKVEIYEVDSIGVVLPRIPDLELDRWRDLILDPKLPIPPIPPDPPGPVLEDSISIDPSERRQLVSEIRSTDFPASLQLAAKAGSAENFRAELLRHPYVVRPLLCLYFPSWIRLTKICETTTDHCGKFRCCFLRSIFNPDKPDLYFKAFREIGPFKFPIYAPKPIPCFTRWNYTCGTEVTLYTSSPFAQTCPPCPPVEAPNNWVLVMAIGNHSLADIRGTNVGLNLEPETDETTIGLTGSGRPFAGLLRPRLEFDNALRDSLGVRYYSVSWRKRGTTDAFQALDRSVSRHYIHEVDTDVVIDAYSLGPKTVGVAPNQKPNLYEIPPSLPPKGQWSLPNVVEDTANAYFPTADFVPPTEAGTYEIKIDLFDTAGNPVDITVPGKEIKFVVPEVVNLGGTITTEDASHPDLNLVSGNSFIMPIHIDNNECTADIKAPEIAGVPASSNCGVLEYSGDGSAQTVKMDYSASHPNGFATFSFNLYRGATHLPAQSTLEDPDPVPVGDGSHSVSATANALLGGCNVAGFAERLHVDALATNGWSIQNHLDAGDVRAFVLAPEPPTP